MKPFVKWVGGKRKLLKYLLPLFPEYIEGTYYEPFLGSGAMFFALKERQPDLKAVLSDANLDLMVAYQQVRDNPDELIQWLCLYEQKHKKDPYTCYDDVRSQDRFGYDKFADVCKAARLIYLNHTCFNGLWRVNCKGFMNVPMGKYVNPTICDREAIMECHRALQGVTILCQDYHKIRPITDDWLYCDPPYCEKYAGYHQGGFGHTDTSLLAWNCYKWREKGVHILVSNSDVVHVRNSWGNIFGKPWEFQTVQRSGTINSDATKRQKVQELIIYDRT